MFEGAGLIAGKPIFASTKPSGRWNHRKKPLRLEEELMVALPFQCVDCGSTRLVFTNLAADEDNRFIFPYRCLGCGMRGDYIISAQELLELAPAKQKAA
jgi:hypothetical protein